MKLMRTLCLISLGGFMETMHGSSNQDAGIWLPIFLVSALGWSWAAIGKAVLTLQQRFVQAMTGQKPILPATDPKALAAEMAALNAQISQLRDTATSFDVSFDHTLQRLDERLHRLEQQSAYVQVRQGQ